MTRGKVHGKVAKNTCFFSNTAVEVYFGIEQILAFITSLCLCLVFIVVKHKLLVYS